VLHLVANHIIRGGPGVTMPSIDADDNTSDDETRNSKLTKAFKRRARSTSHHKTADELKCRVSLISKNEDVVLTYYRNKFVNTRTK